MKRNAGFTLIELMVTLAIGVILIAVGVPSFRGIIMDNRLATEANYFVTSVGLARSAAVRYQRNATICASTDFNAAIPSCVAGGVTDWSTGWIVWVDKDRDAAIDADEVLSVSEPLNDNSTFGSAAVRSFSYDARGFGLGAADTLTLCDSRTGEVGRVISVNVVGRTDVQRQDCS